MRKTYLIQLAYGFVYAWVFAIGYPIVSAKTGVKLPGI